MAKNKNYKYVDKIKTSYGWRYVYDDGSHQYKTKDVESTGHLISRTGKSIANESRSAYTRGVNKVDSPETRLVALNKKKQNVESIGHLISRTGKSIVNESQNAYTRGVKKDDSPETRLAALNKKKQDALELRRNYDPEISDQTRKMKTRVQKALKLKLRDLGENINESILMNPTQRAVLRDKVDTINRYSDWEERQKKEDENRRKNEQFLESIGVRKNKKPWSR